MMSANLVTEIHEKLWDKTALGTGEPCTYEYVTLLQLLRRGTLSKHLHITQNFQPKFFCPQPTF